MQHKSSKNNIDHHNLCKLQKTALFKQYQVEGRLVIIMQYL